MASACVFPEELISKPLGYVALTGLDVQYNAIHKSIWETFSANKRHEKLLNIKVVPGDTEFLKRKQTQRTAYDFYVPKGILKSNWMSKHLYQIPALVVVFFDLDWNDPQWKEKQTECASRVAVIRASLSDRATKIAVVLIQKNMPLPPGEDPQAVQRAEALCQACQLSKTLFVLPFSENPEGYIARLEVAFYEITQTHYAAEAKAIKQHKELLNKSQHQLLFIRHQFKIAFYNELRQDTATALKHYKMAYQYILEHRITDVNNLEVKVTAGFINYKICRLSFQLSAPLDAISQFRKHIDYFKGKVGPKDLAFEHSAWLAKQFSLFGDMFQESIKNGLQAIQTQHPGFYYQQAASHSLLRTQQAKNLCAFSDVNVNNDFVDSANIGFYGQRPWRPGCQASEAPDATMEQAGVLALQSQEAQVEHYWIVIPLLSSAVAQFREYKSIRMKLSLMVEMGEEYFNARDYGKALTLMNRVAPFYRGERWWMLLTSVLTTTLRCAYLTASVKDYVTLCLELLSNNCNIGTDEKTRIQMNLHRISNGTLPEPENKCEATSLEQAKQLWKNSIENEKEKNITIDLESLASFIECRPSFEKDVVQLDQVVYINVYLRSVSAFPIRFSELGIQFSNPIYNNYCIHHDTATDNDASSDLYLEPGKVKVHRFKLILSPQDVDQKLEVKQLYVRLGDNITLRWNSAGLDANIPPSYDSYIYGGERVRVKTDKLNNIVWETVHISPFASIEAREARLDLQVDHSQPALVDEMYQFTVKVKNNEETIIQNTQLTVKLVSEETEATSNNNQQTNLYLDEADGGEGEQIGLKQVEFDLSALQPQQEITKLICMKTTEIGPKKISFKTSYNVLVNVEEKEVKCHCSKDSSVNVNVQAPFSIAARITNMQFQQIDHVQEGSPFTLTTYLKCSSPLFIVDTRFQLKEAFQSVDEELISQLKGLTMKSGGRGGECQCMLAKPSDKSAYQLPADTNTPIVAKEMGAYIIKWKRLNSDREIETKVNLPLCKVDKSLFSIKAKIPSFGCVEEAMLVDYVIENRTKFVQEMEVNVQPSDAFMLSGNSQIQLRILPEDSHVLSYNLFPLYPGELLLPRIHLNLPQYKHVESDVIAQQYLPKYVFVKPKLATMHSSNQIQVM